MVAGEVCCGQRQALCSAGSHGVARHPWALGSGGCASPARPRSAPAGGWAGGGEAPCEWQVYMNTTASTANML